jgi:hypothetical protein
MQLNEENLKYCLGLVNQFEHLKRPPKDPVAAQKMLAMALVGACTSQAIAFDVVALTLENEEEFPAPATLRKYLRGQNYLEEDAARRDEMRFKTQAAEEKAELDARDARATCEVSVWDEINKKIFNPRQPNGNRRG